MPSTMVAKRGSSHVRYVHNLVKSQKRIDLDDLQRYSYDNTPPYKLRRAKNHDVRPHKLIVHVHASLPIN